MHPAANFTSQSATAEPAPEATANPALAAGDAQASTEGSNAADRAAAAGVPLPLTRVQAVSLLLQLFKGLTAQHAALSSPTPTTRTANAPTSIPTGVDTCSVLEAHSVWVSEMLQHADSRGLQDTGLQLAMLTSIGDGQIAHVAADGIAAAVAAAARVPPAVTAAVVGGGTSDSAGANTGASKAATQQAAAAAAAAAAATVAVRKACAGSCTRASCCAASVEVLRCITVVVLSDTTTAAATQRETLQGMLST